MEAKVKIEGYLGTREMRVSLIFAELLPNDVVSAVRGSLPQHLNFQHWRHRDPDAGVDYSGMNMIGIRREIGDTEADIVAKVTKITNKMKTVAESAMQGLSSIEVEFTV